MQTHPGLGSVTVSDMGLSRRLDEVVKENARLREEVRAIREYYAFQPPTTVRQGPLWWIALDGYEVSNLRSMLEAAGAIYQTAESPAISPGPLGVFNSGDWLAQIYLKLPLVPNAPNVTPQRYREAAALVAERGSLS